MTNAPSFKRAYKNTKEEAKYLLSVSSCRPYLISGTLLACSVVALSLLLSYTIISASPFLYNDEDGIISSGVLFLAAAFFSLFFLPPIYCGLYNVACISYEKKEPQLYELFKFYASPTLWLRSIKVFLSSCWLFWGLAALMGLVYILIGISIIFLGEAAVASESLLTKILFSYFLFGSIIYVIFRKRKFIFVPLAVEETELSLKECKKAARNCDYGAYRMYLSGDTAYSSFTIFLSILTIGILFILHTSPSFVAKKVAYYKTHKN